MILPSAFALHAYYFIAFDLVITDETILTGDDADFRVNISTVRDRTDDVCSDEIAARELHGQSRK